MTRYEDPPAEQGVFELGVPGFDSAVGALPKGCVMCVIGGPGVGKTVFGIQAACHAVSRGRRVLYVTVVQDEFSLKKQADTLGRDLNELEQTGLLKIRRLSAPIDVSESQQALLELRYEIESFNPDLVIVDGAAALCRELDSHALVGMVERGLLQEIRERGTVMIGLFDEEGLERNQDLKQYIMETSDVALWLGWKSVGNLRVRSARVLKARGIEVKRPEWSFVISEVLGGIGATSLPESLDHIPRREGSESTGLAGLDEILGGGLPRGSLTLILGPAGAGKIALVSAISANLANKGRRVLVLSFELMRRDFEALLDRFGLRPENRDYVTIRSVEPRALDTLDQLAEIMKFVLEADPEFLALVGYASVETWLGQEVALAVMRHIQYTAKMRDILTLVSARAKDPEERANAYAPYADVILTVQREEVDDARRVMTVLKHRLPELEGRAGALEIERGVVRVVPA